MCIDFMLLAETVSDSCVDHVKKTPKVQAAGNGHIDKAEAADKQLDVQHWIECNMV